jgi:hypothetical protein
MHQRATPCHCHASSDLRRHVTPVHFEIMSIFLTIYFSIVYIIFL